MADFSDLEQKANKAAKIAAELKTARDESIDAIKALLSRSNYIHVMCTFLPRITGGEIRVKDMRGMLECEWGGPRARGECAYMSEYSINVSYSRIPSKVVHALITHVFPYSVRQFEAHYVPGRTEKQSPTERQKERELRECDYIISSKNKMGFERLTIGDDTGASNHESRCPSSNCFRSESDDYWTEEKERDDEDLNRLVAEASHDRDDSDKSDDDSDQSDDDDGSDHSDTDVSDPIIKTGIAASTQDICAIALNDITWTYAEEDAVRNFRDYIDYVILNGIDVERQMWPKSLEEAPDMVTFDEMLEDRDRREMKYYYDDWTGKYYRSLWSNTHPYLLTMCLILAPLKISPYELLWIVDMLPNMGFCYYRDGHPYDPNHARKLRLFEGVARSYQDLKASS
jgi:hypothetical protein